MEGTLAKFRQQISQVLKYGLNFVIKNGSFLCSLNQLSAEIRKHSVDSQNELGKIILD